MLKVLEGEHPLWDTKYLVPNLTIVEASVNSLLVEDQICKGIQLQDGSEIKSDSVILTTGTFLGGRVHIGRES
jgi:tRNA uridine 5-carboxymethylaminomethyl modification enzyme